MSLPDTAQYWHDVKGRGKSKPKKNKTKKKNKHMTTITELADFSNGQVIEEIEGNLTGLFEPKGDNPKYDKQQNGYLKDEAGNEHRICFAANRVHQDMSTKGSRIRLKSKSGARGYTGVKMKVEGNGEYRKIWVTATAIVEIVNGQMPSNKTTAQPAKAAAAATQASNTKQVAERPSGESTVKQRVYDYFRVLSVVHTGYAAMKEGFNLPEIPEEGMRQIATHLSMGYKGQYGVYAPPFFGDSAPKAGPTQSPPQKEERQLTDATTAPVADTATAPPVVEPPATGWKAFVHSKSGVTLGAMATDDKPKLMKLIEWSFTWDGDNQAARQLKVNLHLAAADLGVSRKIFIERAVVAHFKEAKGVHIDACDKFANEKFGIDWDELSDDDSAKLLKDLPGMLTGLTTIHNALTASPPAGEDEIPA